jgi:L-threonylcarbamoyladenylate synthase
MSTPAEVAAALAAGRLAILPTDTVYGICAVAGNEDAVRRLSRVKRRSEGQPIALLAAELEQLLELVPELAEAPLRAVLPGPYTLVLPNPARRLPWLTGWRPETIGVRVPSLTREAAAALPGTVAATSANLTGGPDPRRLDDVPAELRAACGAELDGGWLPGTPSSVLDLTGPEPRVLREGAGDVIAALAALA